MKYTVTVQEQKNLRVHNDTELRKTGGKISGRYNKQIGLWSSKMCFIFYENQKNIEIFNIN